MGLSICPGCKQNTDRDAGFCSLCGYDFSADRADAYNRRVTFWLRVSCFVCAVITYIAVRSMGRRPQYNDYRDLLLIETISAGLVYAGLKLSFPRSRRKLWHTALIPSFFIVAAVFVWRAKQTPGSSLSLNQLMGASPSGATATAGTRNGEITVLPTVRKAPAAPPTQPAAPSRNDYAALLPLANDCFNSMRRQPEFIVSEIKGAGVAKMLLPASMENAKQLDASRARVRKLQDRLADYESRIRKSASDLTAKVQASAAPEKVKASFLSDVRGSGGEFVRGVIEFATVERKSVAATDEMLAFLRSRVDKFTVVRNRPMFADAADSKKYEALQKQIGDLNARGDALLSHVRTQGERAVRELNSPSDAGDSSLEARAADTRS